MKKIVLSVLFLSLSLLLLMACGGGGGETAPEYTVAVVPTDGIIITSQNPLKVEKGGTAEFDVVLTDGAMIGSVSHGSFDPSTGMIKLTNVTADTRITVTVLAETYAFRFHGLFADSSTVPDGLVKKNSSITLTAGSTREFVGFSVGGYIGEGGRSVSTLREYTFTADSSLANNTGLIDIYANYVEENVFYYDANGGTVNAGSYNLVGTDHYNMSVEESVVKISYSNTYYRTVGAASLFYDDGSFTREGYVLIEYNTRPDGSGEGYSLGSKFSMKSEDRTLYCIWAEDTAHSSFEYEDITISRPAGINAPDWKENGVVITAYTGNDTMVVIPEKIDGKPVIAIKESAFTDKSFETLVLSRFVISIEDGAFKNCTSLKTIYYPDGIYYASDLAFDTSSFEGVKNFYVNATVAPRFSRTTEGAFAMKLTRLLNSADTPRIIVVSGSSSILGLSASYLEGLLDGEYTVINLGTTRTTQGYMWIEAMGELGSDDDIVIYAPENSIYMLGEEGLYWKTIRDLEGSYNIFRHIDISGYKNVISAFAKLNSGDPEDPYNPLATGKMALASRRYEDIINVTSMNEYGDYLHKDAENFCDNSKYSDLYKITLNEMAKSVCEGLYNPNNGTPEEQKWVDYTQEVYVASLNRVINVAKASGAKVYFSFAPIDADKLTDEAKADISGHTAEYDSLILDLYDYDGLVGSSKNYIFAHVYFYNNAYHPNYYGRVWRTYTLYSDLTAMLGKDKKDYNDAGYDYEGCLFEMVHDNQPRYKVTYMN